MARLTPHAIHDLKCKHVVTKGLAEVIGYIHYHKYKVDRAIWLTFDVDTWLHLPYTNYDKALDPLVDSGPRFHNAVADMVYVSSTTPTHNSHLLTPT